jgi:chaperonin cofactor prefoldin
MELQSQRAALKGQQASLTSDHTSAETTLRYLQEQKEDAVVYYAVGRMCVIELLFMCDQFDSPF